MASHPHQETLNIFARRPEFLRRVLELPPDAKIERDDPVVKPPQDHIADAVRVVVSEEGGSKRAIIIEAQINRDDGKGAVWNHYSSGVRLQLKRCPTLLLVVTLTKKLRRWAEKEIDLDRRKSEGREAQLRASRRSRDLQRPVAACGDVL